MADSSTPVASAPSTPSAPASSPTPVAKAAPTPAPKAAPAPAAKAPLTPEPQVAKKPSVGDQVKPRQQAPQTHPAEETKKEAERRKYKLKIDGQEEEVDYSDDEIAVELQKVRAANKRFQEAAESKKKVNAILEFIKKDPIAALKDPAIGIDVEALVEKRLAERYQEAAMPEPEQEKLKLQRELDQYKAREAEATQTREQTAKAEYEKKIYSETEAEFLSALEMNDLPKTNETIATMAQIARTALKHGIELTPAQMAAETRKRLNAVSQNVTRGMKGDKLLAYLGADTVKEVLRARLAAAKLSTAEAPPPPAPVAPPADPKPKKLMSSMEFRKKHMFGL